MAATATTNRPELVLAQEIITAAKGGDITGALARAERGARKYPEFRIPAKEGQATPTFSQTAAWLRTQLQPVAPPAVPQEDQAPRPAPRKTATPSKAAPTAKPASAAKKTVSAAKAPTAKATPAAKPAPAPVSRPVKVEMTTLRLVHDGKAQTSIFGVEKDSPAHLAIGAKRRGGLGWSYYYAGDCFYLPKSGGYAPDYRAINEAISRLEALEQDGQQLYQVESEIVTEVDGRTLPVKMTAAEAKEWQRAYDAARNALSWNLSMTQAVCGTCDVTGLGKDTGRIGRGADGLPVMECNSCGVFAAPTLAPEPDAAEAEPHAEAAAAPVPEAVPDLSGLLELAAEPAPLPESAQCPTCRQLVPVTDGRLRPHTGRYGNGACRGRLGVQVTDVEPKPAPQPAHRRAARKAVPAPATSVAESDDDVDAMESAAGLVVRFALQAGLSKSAMNATATEMRQALKRVYPVFPGVKIEGRRNKVTNHMVLTVFEGGEEYDAVELTGAIAVAVKGVRGVGNRIRK